MVNRFVPSVLGKRCIQELYHSTARSSLLESPFRLTPRRNFCGTTYKWQKDDGRPGSASSEATQTTEQSSSSEKNASSTTSSKLSTTGFSWDDNPDLTIQRFSDLPEKDFGVNQHIVINEEFKEALRQILWQFKAPIRYAFAYGSGVFPQTKFKAASSGGSTLHPNPPEAVTKVQGGNQKMIDFIFGVSFAQHWHSLNLQEHRNHYSAIGSAGSYVVSQVQRSFGAGVYFNPYITVNGTLIKYGVVNIDTLCKDLSEWNTLYIAGRLQKPVKILRDNPSVRLANQVNLISAVRTALLLLPENFTEHDLYTTIAGLSYMGDPRMKYGGENLSKITNIVENQLPDFRRLYSPLIDTLPNISFNDSVTDTRGWYEDPSVNAKLAQNMDPVTRGHMVRRLPPAFRDKLYFEYQRKWKIPRGEFNQMIQKTKDEDPERIRRREGGDFEQRIARDTEGGGLREELRQVIQKTVSWPSVMQTVKAVVTAGLARSWRYAREKRQKAAEGKAAKVAEAKASSNTEEVSEKKEK